MQYAKNNALLHQMRMQEMEQRKLEEHIQEIRDAEPMMNGTGEAEVVKTALLATVLNRWRKRFEVEVGDFESGDFVGPIGYLMEQSGIERRAIYRIMHMESKYTSLTHAERMLMAIDREYMMYNGEIPVIPNPQWSYARWVNYMDSRGCTTDSEYGTYGL